MVMTMFEPSIDEVMLTRDFAHLQALSRRLPSISSRSSRLHADGVIGGDVHVDREAAIGVEAEERAGEGVGGFGDGTARAEWGTRAAARACAR